MKKRIYSVMALLLVTALLFTACGGGQKPTEPTTPDTSTPAETSGDKPEEPSAPTTSDNGRTDNIPVNNILRTNNSSEPGSLDPAKAQGTHESWILNHIFEGLMKTDEAGNTVNGVAKEIKSSEDGLHYTFVLRDDVKWSNGDPVTAHDFEYSWKRAANPLLASDYAFQLYYIKGAEEFNSVEKPGIYYVKDEEGKDTTEIDHEVKYTDADLQGLDVGGKSQDEINEMVFQKWLNEKSEQMMVKATDDYTLEVELAAPTGYFDQLTAFYTYYPVNKKVAEANPDWAKNADTHVSNGPFKLTKWEHDARIEIRKNDNYYAASDIKLDGIDFDIISSEDTAWQKYSGGDYDVDVTLPQAVVAQMNEQKDPELVIGSNIGVYYYNLNGKNEFFKNKNIRKAFVYSLDRTIICEKVAQGGQMPALGVIPEGLEDENGNDFRKSQGDLLSYDLEKAKAYLEEGLKELGKTKEDMNGMVILYNTSEAHKKIAQVAQQMWKQNLGIDVKLENVEFQVKLDREKAGDYTISRAGWVGDYADPMTIMDLWYSTSSFNDAKYNNPAYDALIDKCKATNDQKVRMPAMKEAEKMLMEDVPIVPVYYYTQPYAVKSYVKGVYKPILNYPSMIYAEIQK